MLFILGVGILAVLFPVTTFQGVHKSLEDDRDLMHIRRQSPPSGKAGQEVQSGSLQSEGDADKEAEDESSNEERLLREDSAKPPKKGATEENMRQKAPEQEAIESIKQMQELKVPVPLDFSRWHDRKGYHFLEDPSPYLDENQLMKAVAKKSLQKQAIKLAENHKMLNYTLAEILEMPSEYKPGEQEFSPTTVILNHWKRDSLEVQLQALLQQTLMPQEVWLCLFNSDREDFYRSVVEKYKDHFHGNLYVVSSDFNFKYYGRFQLALQAHTKYVWLIDDDILPGSRFLEILTHVGGIKDLKGAFGSVGWLMPFVDGRKRNLPSYREPGLKGGLYFPDMKYRIPNQMLTEVDLLCSQWFLETNSVRLLFREPWITFETAEDYHLAYSLRKFANTPSYVLPMDLTDSRTWGNVDLEQSLQAAAATTTMSMVKIRVALWQQLVARGGEYFLLKHKEAAKKNSRVLLIIESPNSFQAALEFYPMLYKVKEFWDTEYSNILASDFSKLAKAVPKIATNKKMVDTSEYRKKLHSDLMVAFSSVPEVDCTSFFEKIKFDKNSIPEVCRGRYHGVFDLRVGRDFPVAMRSRDIYLTLVQSTSEVVRNSNVGAIIRIQDDNTLLGRVATDASNAVSELQGIPQLSVPYNELKVSPWLAALPPLAIKYFSEMRFTLMVAIDKQINQESFFGFVSKLSKAQYMADKVGLVFAASLHHLPPMFVENSIEWPHGEKTYQIKLSSKLEFVQILESWTPLSDKDYLIMLKEQSDVFFAYYSLVKLYLLLRNASNKPIPESGMCLEINDTTMYLFTSENWAKYHSECKNSVCKSEDILKNIRCKSIERVLKEYYHLR